MAKDAELMSLARTVIKRFLKFTPFYPTHIGDYIRNIYFSKCTESLPWKDFSRILDSGCGHGQYAKKLAIRHPHLKIDAYDIRKYKSWDDAPKNLRFRQKDLLKLTDQNCYDFCLNIDVLEHISENHKVIENIRKALKIGGYFYLHMPGKSESRIFPEKFFREFDDWAKEEHVGEMYELDEIKETVVSIGFEIVEARETFGLLGSFAWEIDRITDKHIFLKIILMPLLKLLSHLDAKCSRKGGGVLVLAVRS